MEPTSEETPKPEIVNDDDAGITQFPTEPFVAKGGGTPLRFGATLIAGLAAAVAIDYVFNAFSSYAIAFFILFPIALGCLLGLAVGVAAVIARARSGQGSIAVTLIALICGAICYAGFHVVYFQSGADPDAVGGETFLQSLERRATKGYVLRGKRGRNSNFGYTGTWIYWAVELGITMVGSAAIARGLSKGPYCEVCDKWNRKRSFGPFPFDALAGHEAFTSGEPTRMFVPGPDDNKVRIEVYDCPTCPDDPLSIKYTGTIGSGKTMKTHSAFLVYPHEALPAFEAIEVIANRKS